MTVGAVVTGRAPSARPFRVGRRVRGRHRAAIRHALGVEREGGGRLLVLSLFWWMLAAAFATWWFGAGANLEPESLGRATGMVGGYLLLVQVLMMSRVGWLTAAVSVADLSRWHRWVGGGLVAAISAHAWLMLSGVAAGRSLTSVSWTLVTGDGDLRNAFLAAGLLVVLAVMAVAPIRRRMSYEWWHLLHRGTYAVLLLAFGHQFAMGGDLSGGWARWWWGGLYAAVVTCLFWGRLVEPVWLNARHRLSVADVVQETPDTVSIHLAGRRLDRFDARAGLHYRWRFLTAGRWWRSHPFSLSAAADSQRLRITVKGVGDHTRALRALPVGARVWVDGPSGAPATPPTGRRAALIGAGSGITAIRALAESMPAGTPVLYRVHREADLLFDEEWAALAAAGRVTVSPVVGGRDDPLPRAVVSVEGLRRWVPDLADREVYLCGPPGFLRTLRRLLRRAGVPADRIHNEPFEY